MSEIVTALATPFVKGKVDLNSLAKLVEHQRGKVEGILFASTTGEGMALTLCEKKLIAKICQEVAPNTPLWMGISPLPFANVGGEIALAESVGAKRLLICPPAFCKCTPKGYFEHIKSIKKATNIALTLYNAPSRVGYNLPICALKRLSELGVDSIKEAGCDFEYLKKVAKYLKIYCGNEQIAHNFTQLGCCGDISVLSNVEPTLVRHYFDKTATLPLKEKFELLSQLCALQTNPMAIKYMLFKLGIFKSCQTRLPLTALKEKYRKMIDEVYP